MSRVRLAFFVFGVFCLQESARAATVLRVIDDEQVAVLRLNENERSRWEEEDSIRMRKGNGQTAEGTIINIKGERARVRITFGIHYLDNRQNVRILPPRTPGEPEEEEDDGPTKVKLGPLKRNISPFTFLVPAQYYRIPRFVAQGDLAMGDGKTSMETETLDGTQDISNLVYGGKVLYRLPFIPVIGLEFHGVSTTTAFEAEPKGESQIPPLSGDMESTSTDVELAVAVPLPAHLVLGVSYGLLQRSSTSKIDATEDAEAQETKNDASASLVSPSLVFHGKRFELFAEYTQTINIQEEEQVLQRPGTTTVGFLSQGLGSHTFYGTVLTHLRESAIREELKDSYEVRVLGGTRPYGGAIGAIALHYKTESYQEKKDVDLSTIAYYGGSLAIGYRAKSGFEGELIGDYRTGSGKAKVDVADGSTAEPEYDSTVLTFQLVFAVMH